MRPPTRRFATVVAAAATLAAVALPAPSFARGAPCAGASARPSSTTAAAPAAATLCLLNRQRARYGLRPLRSDPRLALAAWRHSRDMAQHNYFAHGDFVGRLAGVGYLRGRRSWTVGENIAWGAGASSTPGAIVDMWMHSPGHRANILNPRFHQIGVGLVAGAPVPHVRGATYTTDFGG